MKENEKAYIAGLFDGDGCVEVSYNKPRKEKNKYGQFYIRCTIVNDHKPVIDWIYKNYDGSTFRINPHKMNHRCGWRWAVNTKKASTFLKDIYPYSIIKKEQIKLALEFLETVSYSNKKLDIDIINKRIKIKDKIRKLKVTDYR